mmetsp:Transcript_14932/g.37855  ORF Transcript_14932/g.37855 Transcript_14932/m.37855 type:complete len:227 (-) Transcript_14932:137-817(-)
MACQDRQRLRGPADDPAGDPQVERRRSAFRLAAQLAAQLPARRVAVGAADDRAVAAAHLHRVGWLRSGHLGNGLTRSAAGLHQRRLRGRDALQRGGLSRPQLSLLAVQPHRSGLGDAAQMGHRRARAVPRAAAQRDAARPAVLEHAFAPPVRRGKRAGGLLPRCAGRDRAQRAGRGAHRGAQVAACPPSCLRLRLARPRTHSYLSTYMPFPEELMERECTRPASRI